MASISKKQIEAANSKLANGFELNVYYYLMHGGEKTATKMVEIGDKTWAKLQLMYMPEYEKKNGYRQETGRQIPTCHVSKEFEDGDFFRSYGLGKFIPIGEAQSKKLFSALQKLSAKIDVEELVKQAFDEPNTIEESKSLF